MIAPSALFLGWALSKMWFWFVCPFGVSALGVLQAWGLALTIRMFTGTRDARDDEDVKVPVLIGKTIGNAIILLILLGIGWTAHAIMVVS
jgi:hypothetical protein